MNNQKQQKPTLSGQRFKTRKRGKLNYLYAYLIYFYLVEAGTRKRNCGMHPTYPVIWCKEMDIQNAALTVCWRILGLVFKLLLRQLRQICIRKNHRANIIQKS